MLSKIFYYRVINTFLGVFITVFMCIGQPSPEEKQKLQLGDAAPPLKYSKWLQGSNPIKELDKNRTYLIEFWATWCGPCIQAMPHLTEMSKKYAGRVDVIGCDVWENSYGGPKDQESYTTKVKGFVQDQYNLGRMTYNVIMDNTAEDMGNNWLKAAGMQGIPATFLIHKGQIVWTGHPIYVDSILAAVLDGSYNMQAEKARQAQRAKRNSESSSPMNTVIKAYKDAEEAKDYDKALQLMDTAIAKFPKSSYLFTTDKFKLLLKHYSEEKAMDYGRELQKDRLAGQVLVANLMKEREDMSPKMNAYAAELLRNGGAFGSDLNAKLLNDLATFFALAGNFKEAAEAERKAVEKARAQKDNAYLTESIIAEFERKAEEYQKKADKMK